MDGFLTSVVTGVIAAIVGGIVAYYFWKRQQRLTQAYEREKERKQQGAEVFGEIETRMNSIIDDLAEYLRRAQMLRARQPSGATIDKLQWDWSVYDAWKPFLLEQEALLKRSNEIDKAMASLRDYYHAHESSVKSTTHRLFASFDEEIISQYQVAYEPWLGENEEPYKLDLERGVKALDRHRATRFPVLGRLKDLDLHDQFENHFSDTTKEFSELAQLLQSQWDLQAYRTALRKEKAKYNG